MSSSKDTLDALLKRKPRGFDVQRRSGGTVHGVFAVEPEGAVEPRRFSLRIKCTGRNVRVRESQPGEELPKACPDRHIERDSNLCIGLDAGQDTVTPIEIDTWWSFLYQFLVLQISAEHTGQWPPKYALAHGAGAAAQIRATETAIRLGIAATYNDYLLGTPNEISELVSDYKRRRTEAMRKDRPVAHLDDALLARSMTWTREHGATKLKDRKRARLVRALAKFELQRIEKELEFWAYCRRSGITCCGTMLRCPLRDTLVSASVGESASCTERDRST